jgi:hypothetical protein
MNVEEVTKEQKLIQAKALEDLYDDLSYKVGIMTLADFRKYAKLINGIENVDRFVDLMQYWGEIVVIRSHLNVDRI